MKTIFYGDIRGAAAAETNEGKINFFDDFE